AILWSEDNPLQATVTANELNPRCHKWFVVLISGRIYEVNRCHVALAAFDAASPSVLPTVTAFTASPSACSRSIMSSRPAQWLPAITRSAFWLMRSPQSMPGAAGACHHAGRDTTRRRQDAHACRRAAKLSCRKRV